MSVVENRDESAPSWLKELEAKREKRVKARLGHEAGAGAPCLTCTDQCPGLDLHFWRKICKNCKCSKENHDINDDDLYGWAQFQLFGNRPNRLIKRIQLPNLEKGTNDEYELDWIPTKGQLDTIDDYLKQLPKDLLPIKGSLAAQLRKQMLQKQLPIHDIDPTLCHELSELEMKKMYDYIEHMKANSVGIGQIIQIGKSHPLLPPPSPPPPPPPAQQQQQRKLTELPRQFEQLTTTDEIVQQPTTIGKIRNIHPTVFETKTSKKFEQNSNLPQLPEYVPDKFDITTNQQQPINIANIKDLAYSTYENPDIINSNYQQQQQPQKSLISLKPLDQYQRIVDNQQPDPVRIGLIRDINYDFSGGDETSVPLATPSSIAQINDNERQIQNFPLSNKTCKRCQLQFDCNEFAIYVDRNQSYYHTNCFKCNGCNQNLVDMFYFYDHDNDDIYCGRDFAKIRGIPRCKACDELIFVKEYCLAENATYHIKHFCCFECDQPLAGKNYLIDNDDDNSNNNNNNNNQQPLCLNCYELLKANKCETCKRFIKPDEQGCTLNGVHFHAENQCFCCCICKLPLFGAKLLLRNKKLYCSHQCYQQQQQQ